MGALAAHLVDGVLGGLPVRQWVLTLPHRLRYALAYDHRLCPAALAVFVRAALGFEGRRAERRGIPRWRRTQRSEAWREPDTGCLGDESDCPRLAPQPSETQLLLGDQPEGP